VYVWPVGGYLLEPSKVKSELQKFRTKLTEYGLCYVENKFYIAFYDFIVRFHGRQNELWLVVQHCPKVLINVIIAFSNNKFMLISKVR
jgi:hypothetical protein